MRNFALAAMVFTAASACVDSPSFQGAKVRDSAGILIVENEGGGESAARSWYVDTFPELEVGGDHKSDHAEFVRISGLVRLANGGFVVADASRRLSEYDADGRYVKAIGREGAGPGEFRTVSALGVLAGDTLIVWDYALRRFTIFPGDGGGPRTFAASGIPGFLFVTQFINDGSALGIQVPGLNLRDLVPGEIRPQVTVLRLVPSTGELDTITHMPGAMSFVTSTPRSVVVTVPFSPDPQCVADGVVVHCGVGDRYEIRSYSLDGQLKRILRYQMDSRPLPGQAIARLIERRSESARSPEARAETISLYSSLPYPNELPVFDALLVDSERNLWVRDFALPDDPTTHWRVFDSTARLSADVEMPRRFTVYTAGIRDVLGVARDSLDVERVQRLRLRKH